MVEKYGENTDFFGTSFWDKNNGIIVGWDFGNWEGIILKTTDGGTHWIKQVSETPYILNSVSCKGNNFAVIGGYSALLVTTNGGTNKIDTMKFELTAVAFTDTLNGIVVGNNAFLKTTNGGLTWDNKVNQVTKQINAVSFSDSLNGFIVGYDGIIFKTTDSGNNWQKITSNTNYY